MMITREGRDWRIKKGWRGGRLFEWRFFDFERESFTIWSSGEDEKNLGYCKEFHLTPWLRKLEPFSALSKKGLKKREERNEKRNVFFSHFTRKYTIFVIHSNLVRVNEKVILLIFVGLRASWALSLKLWNFLSRLSFFFFILLLWFKEKRRCFL